jgi:UDP-glucose 4-epimerase
LGSAENINIQLYSVKSHNILITGGAGFIGSHLAERLIASGARVTIADNLKRNSYINIQHIRKLAKFLNVDLTTLEGALEATKKQDVVFNLAAINTGIDFDIGRTQYMFEENMLLQMQPLRAAYINKVNKFVQVSSASVYSRKAMEKRYPTKETDDDEEPEPSKLGYALAKKMGEKMATWYSQNTPLCTIIVRPINVYGPRDHFDTLSHFIPTIIRKFIDAKKNIEIYGTGKQKRSFLHVLDLVDALVLLMNKGKNGEIYNIDSHDDHTIKEIVNAVQKIMSLSRISISYNTSMPEGSKCRLLNNQKIKSLGWKSGYELLHELPTIIKDVQSRYATEKKS